MRRSASPEFLFGTELKPDAAPPKFGIVPLMWGTFLVAAGASMIALPIGLLSAIYLSEYAPRPVRAVLKPTLELLAGIPTIVYGYLALLLVTPVLKGLLEPLGVRVETFNALAACIVVGVMIIPLVSSLSEDVLSAVPRGLREAAYGLGATKFEVSTRIVLPAGALRGLRLVHPGHQQGRRRDDGRRAGRRDASPDHLEPTDLDRNDDHLHRPGHRRRCLLRRAQVPLVVRRRPDALRRDSDVEHHLRPGLAALSRGLPMSLSEGPRFHPNRWMRRILGPIFGAACLAATCMGVVVLALLLGSILAAALQGPPDHPWYAIGPNLAELFALIRNLVSEPRSRPGPHAAAGISGRDRRQSVAAGSGRA